MEKTQLTYSATADASAILFATDRKQHRTISVGDYINVDVDTDGKPVAIEILGVSHLTDNPGEFEIVGLTQYITAPEMAEYHGVTLKTIHNALQAGKLNGARKEGGDLRGVWLIPTGVARAWQPDPRGRKKATG